MHYFIDGYNLLFRLVRALGDEDLQSMREHIIDDLSRKIKLLNIQATVVFDSYYHEGLRSRTVLHSMEVLFTDEGETADECILDELKKVKHPKQEIVVTSDKKLAWQARLKGAKTLSVEEFVKSLNQRFQKRSGTRVEDPESKQIGSTKSLSAKPKRLDDYYLKVFEEELEEKSKAPKKKIITPPPKKEKPLSDYERWLKAFQEESDES